MVGNSLSKFVFHNTEIKGKREAFNAPPPDGPEWASLLSTMNILYSYVMKNFYNLILI